MGSKGTGFVNLRDAAAIAGVSTDTIGRRVRTGLLPVYRSDADRRVRLVRLVDVETMATPVRGESA